jgi:HAMP domain
MEANPHFLRYELWDARSMSRELTLPLARLPDYGAVFVLGTLVLVLSPATVSARPLLSEVIVLSIGLAVIVLLNGVLLRSVLRPLDRLTAVMAAIDLRQPGCRLDEHGSGPARALVRGFNDRRRADMIVRILLADDHSMVRAGVRHILNAEPDLTVVAEAADCAEAVELARPPRTWPRSTSRCRG